MPWLHRLVRGYTSKEIDRITQGCHIAQPITPGITLVVRDLKSEIQKTFPLYEGCTHVTEAHNGIRRSAEVY